MPASRFRQTTRASPLNPHRPLNVCKLFKLQESPNCLSACHCCLRQCLCMFFQRPRRPSIHLQLRVQYVLLIITSRYLYANLSAGSDEVAACTPNT